MAKSSGQSKTAPQQGSFTPQENANSASIFNYAMPIATGANANIENNKQVQNYIQQMNAMRNQEKTKGQQATMSRFQGAGQNFSSAAAGAVQNAANQADTNYDSMIAGKLLDQYNTEQNRALSTSAGLLTAQNEAAKTRAGLSGSTTVNTQSPWGK